MTVSELIERLEEMNPDAEVRLMTQRHYPLEARLYGVCESAELRGGEDGEDDDGDDGETEPVVYLVEGDQVGYGLKSAWRAAS
jgi:hypothetical protein